MAVSKGDGSIILSTRVDTKGIKRDLGTMIKTINKAFLAVGTAAITATIAITKMAVSAYADYEQLVGGVETLFKDSAKKVIAYAEDAFSTAGISANEYLQTAISVSSSLIQSLGGDTEKAADIANMAIIDMSDNVNKLGTDVERVKMAYAGFARQQYVLLDNLALGYQGTKSEMERLLRDAEAYMASQGKAVKYNINNLSDVYSAINAIQQKLGIAGTTIAEAEKTITGSANMMKAAWKNVLTAVSGGGDLDKAIKNLVYAIQRYFQNIVPVVERSLLGIGTLIEKVAPMLVESVAKSLIKAIPSLISAVYQMIIGLAKGIYAGIADLFSGNFDEKTLEKEVSLTGATASNIEEQTEKQKELNQEMKRTLAGFDEIQTLSSQAAANTSDDSSAPVVLPSIGTGETPTEKESDANTGKYQEIANAIKSALADIMDAASKALLAVGLIVLLSGNIIGGIGLIMAGAAAYVAGDVLSSENPVETLKGHLDTIKKYIIPALFAIGVLLLFLGQILLGIGLIITGAVYAGYKEAQSEEYDEKGIETKLNIIMEYVSAALVALGVILIFFGHIPLGIGLVIAGKELLGATDEKLDEGGVTTKIQKFFDDNMNNITGVAVALLVIGLIMFACGVVTPLSLGLLVTGGIILTSNADINEKTVPDLLNAFIAENAGIIIGVATALLVVGLIMLLTGHITPLSIGLVITGAGILGGETSIVPEAVKNALQGWVGAIIGIVGAFFLVIGLAMLMTGHITPLSIGLTIIGITALAPVVALNWDEVKNALQGWAGAIVAIVSGLFLAIGLVMLMTGHITPLSIGLTIAGVTGLVAIVALNWDKVKESLQGWAGAIVAIVSAFFLVIGLVMLLTGHITPLSIGLTIAGVTGLVTVVTLNWDKVKESLQSWGGAVVAIVSGLFLVIGLVMLMTGHITPLSIALTIAGAAGLVTVVTLNWGVIKEKVSTVFNAVKEWVKTWGLLVLGIILCITGVGIPLGVGLIRKGGANLAAAQNPLWNTILEKVKEVWKNIKDFWDKNIAPVFTATWWKNLAINCGNGLIGGFEAAFNSIIGMFETMLNWIVSGINKISFDVPDWVPNIGGKKFGFNLKKATFGRFNIPRLAQGSVLPGGNPFLAVVNDNPLGKPNVEAPAELIKQMAMEAILEVGARGQTVKEEHYYLNETQLMSIIYKLANGGKRLAGDSLIDGGAF